MQLQGCFLGYLELPEDNLSCLLSSLLRTWCKVSQTRRDEKEMQFFSWIGNGSEVHGACGQGLPTCHSCLNS